MYFFLEDLKVNCHFLEDLDSWFYHQIVDGLGVFETRPHDSLELKSRVDEFLCGLSKNVGENGAVIDNV